MIKKNTTVSHFLMLLIMCCIKITATGKDTKHKRQSLATTAKKIQETVHDVEKCVSATELHAQLAVEETALSKAQELVDDLKKNIGTLAEIEKETDIFARFSQDELEKLFSQVDIKSFSFQTTVGELKAGTLPIVHLEITLLGKSHKMDIKIDLKEKFPKAIGKIAKEILKQSK